MAACLVEDGTSIHCQTRDTMERSPTSPSELHRCSLKFPTTDHLRLESTTTASTRKRQLSRSEKHTATCEETKKVNDNSCQSQPVSIKPVNESTSRIFPSRYQFIVAFSQLQQRPRVRQHYFSRRRSTIIHSHPFGHVSVTRRHRPFL